MAQLNEVPAPKNQWLASLSLQFASSVFGTQLVRTKRVGPLSVQKAFYPEGRDCAHVYLLHPPAGIVSGDELTVNINLAADAHSLVTTPGANRFYRARVDLSIGDSKQRQTANFDLKSGATCENFPQETIVYSGADGVNTVDIHMVEDSTYLGWDITSLGLPSSDKPFEHGQYTQLNRLFCDGKLVFHDRIAISAQNDLLHSSAGLGGHHVFGTFLINAPHLNEPNLVANLLEVLREKVIQADAEHLISITNIAGLWVIRYLGGQAEECKKLFVLMWHTIRPVYLDKQAIKPRIWLT